MVASFEKTWVTYVDSSRVELAAAVLTSQAGPEWYVHGRISQKAEQHAVALGVQSCSPTAGHESLTSIDAAGLD